MNYIDKDNKYLVLFEEYVWMDRFELYRRQNHELTKRMWMSFRIEKNKVKNAKPAWKNEKCYINSWWFLIVTCSVSGSALL